MKGIFFPHSRDKWEQNLNILKVAVKNPHEIMNDVYMQAHQPLNIAYVNSAYLQVPINNFKITKIGRLTHASSARLSTDKTKQPSSSLAIHVVGCLDYPRELTTSLKCTGYTTM